MSTPSPSTTGVFYRQNTLSFLLYFIATRPTIQTPRSSLPGTYLRISSLRLLFQSLLCTNIGKQFPSTQCLHACYTPSSRSGAAHGDQIHISTRPLTLDLTQTNLSLHLSAGTLVYVLSDHSATSHDCLRLLLYPSPSSSQHLPQDPSP